jgi:endonuclease/exonuclease/phosphatase family metal-dependent hydrolase
MLRNKLVVFLILAAGTWAFAADHTSNITIMTQNMDDGTDQTYIVAAALGAIPGFTIPNAVDLTYAELQASHLPARAVVLAGQIAQRKPDLLALQEASLWRIGPTPDTATTILYDQIANLLAALNSAGVPYDVVAVNAVNDTALAGHQVPALRFTDRDAILIRSDLRPPSFHLSDVHSKIFDAALPFPPLGVQIMAGWIAADVHTGNQHFRLLTTHLMSPISGVPAATQVQVAQAQELLQEVRNSAIPVVLCGDFNSDALQGGGLDTTPTAPLIQAAGYSEVWPLLHSGSDKGQTWPLYLEDQFPPPPFFALSSPFERIDLFFAQGIQPLSIDRVISPSVVAVPPFGSDHAGVIAVFQP